MYKKILIANRGEIALRIVRTVHELGLKAVAVYSEVDANLEHVKMADEAICIGRADPHDSYLNITAILKAAHQAKVDAIHPGYGFLAENTHFVERVLKQRFGFIGPSLESLQKIVNKIDALAFVKSHGLLCVPGSDCALKDDPITNLDLANTLGYPVIIKAAFGGGGQAINVAHSHASLLKTIEVTKEQAGQLFGDFTVYMEKFLENSRHIEVQILADNYGNAIYLGDRDCSMQRHKQKVIDEAPAPNISEEQRIEISEKCIKICKELHLSGAITFEFLYHNGIFYFIELNPRIQVGHPVTELISEIDLVKQQILIAAGEKLLLQQKDVHLTGHAIQCRIYAEESRTLIPTFGVIKNFFSPGGPGIRVDTQLYSGYTVPEQYDRLIGKLAVYNDTRASAISRMSYALDEMIIDGIVTNLPLHRLIMNDDYFINVKYTSDYLEKKFGPITKLP